MKQDINTGRGWNLQRGVEQYLQTVKNAFSIFSSKSINIMKKVE